MKTIKINYAPQNYQLSIHNSNSRFRVVVVGRRGGKTVLSINEMIKRSIQKPGLYWFVAPSYKQAKNIAWVILKKLLKVDTDWKFNESELSAEHPYIKTRIELKGADNEDSLRGVGLQGVVLDECATMKANVWPEIIRPMLLDSNGWALFIGTPKGKNWFWDIAMSKGDDWQMWQHPTSVNKYIDQKELEQLKSEMPERLYQQEIEAKFLDDDSSVFRKIAQCAVGEFKEPVLGRRYVIGADLAKHEDWTVLSVIDSNTLELVAFERFNQISWPDQKLKILELAHRYNNALVLLDSTGVGDAIYDDLQNSRVAVEGFKFTNESKRQLIEKLVISIEQRFIIFPRIPILIDELQRFSYELTAEGKFRYNAPEGFHDDCVISLALANWAVRSEHYPVRQLQKLATEDPIDRQGQGERVDYEYQFQENISGY